jgi:hypothetical protein
MADLQQQSDPDRSAGVDVVGWIFAAFAAAIVAVAVVIAYEGHDTQLANAPVPHLAAR